MFYVQCMSNSHVMFTKAGQFMVLKLNKVTYSTFQPLCCHLLEPAPNADHYIHEPQTGIKKEWNTDLFACPHLIF